MAGMANTCNIINSNTELIKKMYLGSFPFQAYEVNFIAMSAMSETINSEMMTVDAMR